MDSSLLGQEINSLNRKISISKIRKFSSGRKREKK
jgi:hypothetical protein